MALRTTTAEVQALLEAGLNYDTVRSPALDPFLTTANVITDRVATRALAKGKQLTSSELIEIEKYLAAHFYAITDKTYSSRSTGGASGSFDGQTGMRLEATLYGQQAMVIDYSGVLESISNKQMRVGIVWGGKRESEALDWPEWN